MPDNIYIKRIRFEFNIGLAENRYVGDLFYARKYQAGYTPEIPDKLDNLIKEAVEKRFENVSIANDTNIIEWQFHEGMRDYEFGFHAASKNFNNQIDILQTSLGMIVCTEPEDAKMLDLGVITLCKEIEEIDELETLIHDTFVPFDKVKAYFNVSNNLQLPFEILREQKTEEEYEKYVQEIKEKLGLIIVKQ